MNKNFNVLKISGFKGIFILLFLVACFATGFMIMPGWLCMHAWNFVSGFFMDMPRMTLLHGSLLWLIIALSIYALNKGDLSISFGTPANMPMPLTVAQRDEKIKEIIRKINEHNRELALKEHDKCESSTETKDNTSVSAEENNDEVINK